MRRTDQALIQIIEGAQRSLLIVSFAVYSIPVIRSALIDAAARHVQIQLFIESPEESGGRLAYHALHTLGANMAHAADIYIWPQPQRPRNQQGQYGVLHANGERERARRPFICGR